MIKKILAFMQSLAEARYRYHRQCGYKTWY